MTLKREEVERVVLGGFFPPVVDDAPEKRRGGIATFGLPYEREPAITRHVRQFLVRHASEMSDTSSATRHSTIGALMLADVPLIPPQTVS